MKNKKIPISNIEYHRMFIPGKTLWISRQKWPIMQAIKNVISLLYSLSLYRTWQQYLLKKNYYWQNLFILRVINVTNLSKKVWQRLYNALRKRYRLRRIAKQKYLPLMILSTILCTYTKDPQLIDQQINYFFSTFKKQRLSLTIIGNIIWAILSEVQLNQILEYTTLQSVCIMIRGRINNARRTRLWVVPIKQKPALMDHRKTIAAGYKNINVQKGVFGVKTFIFW